MPARAIPLLSSASCLSRLRPTGSLHNTHFTDGENEVSAGAWQGRDWNLVPLFLPRRVRLVGPSIPVTVTAAVAAPDSLLFLGRCRPKVNHATLGAAPRAPLTQQQLLPLLPVPV